jgi:hypothetical protein
MFLNKFDVEIVYVFKVGIIIITFKNLFIRSNIFVFKFLIPIFWQVFCYLHFSLNFHFFPVFSQQEFQV